MPYRRTKIKLSIIARSERAAAKIVISFHMLIQFTTRSQTQEPESACMLIIHSTVTKINFHLLIFRKTVDAGQCSAIYQIS